MDKTGLAVLPARRDARKERVAILEFRTAVAIAGFDVGNEHRVVRETTHRHKRLLAITWDDDMRADVHTFRHALHLPPLRDVAERGRNARDFFVARESEEDEPLAV